MKYYVPTSLGSGMVQVAKFEDAYVKVSDHEQAVAKLTDEVHELERLCDATYVQQGADAYDYACALIEQLQGERIANGREPGTQGSLCDGLAWAYGELMKAEDEITRLRAEVDALRLDAERYRCLRRKVAIVGGDSKAEFRILNLNPRYVAPKASIELDAAIDAAMGESA